MNSHFARKSLVYNINFPKLRAVVFVDYYTIQLRKATIKAGKHVV